MNDTVLITFLAVLSPVIMAFLTNRYRHQDKIEDYARQDLLAKRVEDAARRAADTASALTVANKNTEISRANVDAKLNEQKEQLVVIHTLVNSTLSAAKVSELNAYLALFALMLEPSGINAEKIEATRQKIVELQNLVNERAAQTELVETQRKN